MTIPEARAHFKARLEMFEDEKEMLMAGMRKGEFWSKSEGAEAAIAELIQLHYAYKRILNVINEFESRQKFLENMK